MSSWNFTAFLPEKKVFCGTFLALNMKKIGLDSLFYLKGLSQTQCPYSINENKKKTKKHVQSKVLIAATDRWSELWLIQKVFQAHNTF